MMLRLQASASHLAPFTHVHNEPNAKARANAFVRLHSNCSQLRLSVPESYQVALCKASAELGSTESAFEASPVAVLPVEADAGDFPDAARPHHLIIMVNGIVGSANDWRFAADQIKSRFGDEVLVLCSRRNAATLTFDGVDVMGHRLAEEIKEAVNKSPGLKRISFIAHSLGGLIARYAIGQLYSPCDTSHLSTIERYDRAYNGTILGLQPMNFITVATPHLGSRGNWQLPFLAGLSFLEKVAMSSAHWIVGRTGKHLFLTDGDESQAPLLQQMVKDCAEGQFLSALGSFERRVAYANVSFDRMVGWRTATLRRMNEDYEIKQEAVNIKYPHIVNVEHLPPETKPAEGPDPDAAAEMISGLRQLSWQRVDVSFSKTLQKLDAHSTIQVKSYWIHSDGADVIEHIIDNLRF
ncbi:hypothetical protein KP509_1Z085800 [Ceratopteris richardii]|nr:hypothetical protein KP509_1Z085800 [Ceratopteris richardii]KAH6557927.1 hypothetical protein KP509_1Z085800 [Ceratopteris richardii]